MYVCQYFDVKCISFENWGIHVILNEIIYKVKCCSLKVYVLFPQGLDIRAKKVF